MPISEELQLTVRGAGPGAWLWRMRPHVKRLLEQPGLRRLHSLARRAGSVAEPAGRVHIRPQPDGSLIRPTGTPLTILSANLKHDWPRHRRLPERLAALADLCTREEVDILLLQEVAHTTGFSAHDWLAGRLGMASVYARVNGHRDGIGFEEGLAILSRFPLREPVLRQLGGTANPFARRLSLGAWVEAPEGRLVAFTNHLGLGPRSNARQLEELEAWVQAVAGTAPALVGGDFNAHETRPGVRRLQSTWRDTFRTLHPSADGTTHVLHGPFAVPLRRQRFDYVFLGGAARDWDVIEARHVMPPEEPHSDHHAVLVRVMGSCQLTVVCCDN